jgi:hypothetical protein
MTVDACAGGAFARRLEHDGLVVLPGVSFRLAPEEADLLAPDISDGKAKNISLAPGGAVRGAMGQAGDLERLRALMVRFSTWARGLIVERAPGYAGALEMGRTSFRPRSVDDEPASPRKDDRRLHVDAFASQPTGGRRILRVFSNVNPDGESRAWRVGEPFEAYARRWVDGARIPSAMETWALARVGVTRERRTPYDSVMLALHDAAKLDADYQRHAPRRVVEFPPGTTWIAFTDALVHAAVRGAYALEQTFYLPLSVMAAPEMAPARILERLTGRTLC